MPASADVAAAVLPRLHLVTDDAVLAADGFADTAAEVLAAAAPPLALHLRGPRTSGRRLYELAYALRDAARAAGALLLVNDRVDVAAAAGADGVQLGARGLRLADARRLLGPEAWVGASVHSAVEAADAAAECADFVLLGTVYRSGSHPGRAGGGAALIRAAAGCAAPIVAIGGITSGRVAEVVSAGAHGVAVLGAVWLAPDPAAAADALQRRLS